MKGGRWYTPFHSSSFDNNLVCKTYWSSAESTLLQTSVASVCRNVCFVSHMINKECKTQCDPSLGVRPIMDNPKCLRHAHFFYQTAKKKNSSSVKATNGVGNVTVSLLGESHNYYYCTEIQPCHSERSCDLWYHTCIGPLTHPVLSPPTYQSLQLLTQRSWHYPPFELMFSDRLLNKNKRFQNITLIICFTLKILAIPKSTVY